MLPETLFGTYQRYKQDTTQFTTWLSKAAIACGFNPAKFTKLTDASAQPSIKSKAQPDSKAPKLKGRARKLARDALAQEVKARAEAEAKKSREDKADKPTIRYAVTSKELLAQAKQVASSRDPTITVPQTVLFVLKRAIQARKKCIAWFEKGGGEDQACTDNHAKFVIVLEEVVSILMSKSTPQATSNSQAQWHNSHSQKQTTELLKHCQSGNRCPRSPGGQHWR